MDLHIPENTMLEFKQLSIHSFNLYIKEVLRDQERFYKVYNDLLNTLPTIKNKYVWLDCEPIWVSSHFLPYIYIQYRRDGLATYFHDTLYSFIDIKQVKSIVNIPALINSSKDTRLLMSDIIDSKLILDKQGILDLLYKTFNVYPINLLDINILSARNVVVLQQILKEKL